tara:strand:- start:247 stop:390 length:144 start_codon:yes stop_codon:yes gene_type:complete
MVEITLKIKYDEIVIEDLITSDINEILHALHKFQYEHEEKITGGLNE